MSEYIPVSLSEILDIGDKLNLILRNSSDPAKRIGFKSHVKQIFETRLLVDIPEDLPPEVEFLIRPEALVVVEFVKEQETLPTLETTILNCEQRGNSLPGLWIKVPSTFKEYFMNRRKHVRVSIRFPLKVYYKPQHRMINSPIPSMSINLSAGGIRFTAQHKFSIDDELLLEFQPDARSPLLKIDGKVVLCKKSPYRTSKTPLEMIVALKFTGLNRHQEDVLMGACFRRELEQKRHLKQE